MFGITDFWTYVLGTAAIILLPGPNSLFVLSVGARRGVRDGYRAACGVFLGDTVLMVLSAAGVASLLRAYPPAFTVIKYAGAGYLAYVGLGILRGAWRRWRSSPTTAPTGTGPIGAGPTDTGSTDTGPGDAGPMDLGATATASTTAGPTGAGPAGAKATSAGPTSVGATAAGPRELRSPFRRAAVISLLNPKAILFFVSFFIQFVRPEYPHPALSFLLLGVVVQVFSALYLSALIVGGRFLAGQFQRRRRLAVGMTTVVGALFVGFSIKLATTGLG